MERAIDASIRSASPRDLRPLVLGGLSILEKDALIRKLWHIFPNCFTIAHQHTTERPPYGLPQTHSHFYVSSTEFQNMASADDFLLKRTYGPYSSGISKHTMPAGALEGRIVVIDARMQDIQQLKALPDFNARYIYIASPSPEVSNFRLSTGKLDFETVCVDESWRRSLVEMDGLQFPVEQEEAELAYTQVPGVYELCITTENLDEALNTLTAFIHRSYSQDESAAQQRLMNSRGTLLLLFYP